MLERSHAGFTLIELLVVATTIVLLLAILAPGLTQAMYQGNLANCSGNLNAISKGALQYAVHNRYFWPYRTAVSGRPTLAGSQVYEGPAWPWLQNDATYKFRRIHTLKEDGNDDRYMLRDWIALKAFQDPLCSQGEVQIDDPRPDDPEYVLADYAILFGMDYSEAAKNFSYQRKLGTKINVAGHEKTTLVADFSATYLPFGYTSASHQDKDGKAALIVRNRTNSNYIDAKWNTPPGTIEHNVVDQPSNYKGYIDFNEAFWDGAVIRYPDIRWDEWKWKPADLYPHTFTNWPLQADGRWRNALVQLKNEDGTNHTVGADPHAPIVVNP